MLSYNHSKRKQESEEKIMAKSTKKHWYVLVCSCEGAKFVTSLGEHHTAYWDDKEKPMELSQAWAFDIARGLQWNGTPAYAVCQEWEQEHQPYAYYRGHFEWFNDEKKTE